MANREIATARFPVGLAHDDPALGNALAEIVRRAMNRWTLREIALTFERPVQVEVTVHHDPKLPRGHITKG